MGRGNVYRAERDGKGMSLRDMFCRELGVGIEW